VFQQYQDKDLWKTKIDKYIHVPMRSLATVLVFFFNLRLLNVTLSFFQPYIAGNPDEHFMGYEDFRQDAATLCFFFYPHARCLWDTMAFTFSTFMI